MKLWLNGKIMPSEAACISPADRGFLLGDGLFETMSVQNGAVPELHRHYARLCSGAALLRLPVPLSQLELETAVSQLLAANGLSAAALRLTLTRGPGPRGLLPPEQPAPTLLLTAADPPGPGAPVRLITCTIRRDETSPLSAVKTLNYLPGILARLEAAERGADDAVLLNQAGRVAETSAASLFVYLRDNWVTPPVREGALPGICRAKLLEAGQIREQAVTSEDLTFARALCIGNALRMQPVLSLDGHVFPLVVTP